MDVTLNGGRPVFKHQLRLIRSLASVLVILGGYASGKTTAAVLGLVVNALKTPWTPEYGDAYPTTIVIGKTERVIRDSSLRVFKQVVPRDLILKERKSAGERSILLEGGHEFIFRSWSGSIEGITAGAAMLDEAHLLDCAADFVNFVARIRDPLTDRKKLVVSGVPEFGWLHDKFGPGATPFPDSEVILCSAYDNTALREEDIQRILASCSSKAAATYVRGQWATPENAVYYEWDPGAHLVDDPGDPEQPCHLSLDVGNRAAVLWWQDRQRGRKRGLHVVDEWTPDQLSARSIMRGVVGRRWRLAEGSLVFVDPATDQDEIDAIYEVGEEKWGRGAINVVRKERGDTAYYRNEGFRCVNTALRDAAGDVLLTVYRGLPRGDRSLITCIPKIRRGPDGQAIKDNKTDHVAMDAFRYPVAHILPLKAAGVSVLAA